MILDLAQPRNGVIVYFTQELVSAKQAPPLVPRPSLGHVLSFCFLLMARFLPVVLVDGCLALNAPHPWPSQLSLCASDVTSGSASVHLCSERSFFACLSPSLSLGYVPTCPSFSLATPLPLPRLLSVHSCPSLILQTA